MAGKQQHVADEALWSALPNDVIEKIGNIFLSTDDLDYYAILRRVCGGWRRAAQEQFMPRHWIVLEHRLSKDDHVDDASVTLLNVKTGRYVEKNIRRVIRRYVILRHVYATVIHISIYIQYRIDLFIGFSFSICYFQFNLSVLVLEFNLDTESCSSLYIPVPLPIS
jgi:hypothetical protein